MPGKIIFYILAKAVAIYLDIASIAILVRVLIPIFTGADGGPLYTLAVVLSEPIIIPFRVISEKFGFWQDTPLDVPLLASSVFLMLASLFLPII